MSTPVQEHPAFTIERLYPAEKCRVWSAWAEPKKKAIWLGSQHHEMDFRPGGYERHSFSNEMGEHTNETRFFEILEGHRIVLAYSMAMNGRVHTVSLSTVVFLEEEADVTRLNYTEQMCLIPPTDGLEGRKHGWGSLLESLQGFLTSELSARFAAE